MSMAGVRRGMTPPRMREPALAKILRYLLYATAFMPLIIFSQYISPFHFGKVVVFRSVVELMLVLYLLLIWEDRSYLPKTNKIFWSFFIFAVAFSLTTITSVIPYQSFWGTLERMGGLWTFWHYFVFFVVLTAVLRTREHWDRFLELTIVSGILSALYGFGQKTNLSFFIGSGGRERIFGTIGNAALFAGYEIVNLFLALTLFVRRESTSNQRLLFGAGVVLGTLAVIMTVVRGSLLGLGVGWFLFSILYYLKTRSPRAKKVILSLVTLAGLFFFILVTPLKDSSLVQSTRFTRRLTDTSFNTYTAKTRFWAWEAGLKGWRDSFKTIALGWGPENFNVPFSKYFNPKFFTGPGAETLFDRAHNMFVEVLVTMGLLGLIAYLGIYAAAFSSLVKLVRSKSNDAFYGIGFIALVVAYAIHNSFIFDTSANFLAFFSVLGFIAYVANIAPQQAGTQTARQARSASGFRVVVGIVMFIAALVLAYKTNVLPSKANYATTRGIIRGWSNDFDGAVAKYREALSYNVPGKYEFRHRFGQYLLEYGGQNKLNPKVNEALLFAIQEIQKNADENPPDYLPHLYISRLYITLGKEDSKSPYNDEALKHSLKALEISPTFVRTYYEVGQAYLNKKESDKAVEYFRKAAELNPDVGLSFWYWGIVEIERGNIQEGLKIVDQALAKGFGGTPADYLRLINANFRVGNYQGIAQMYERLVALDSKNPQYYAGLATAYAQIGRIDDAVAAARKAVALDPSFLEEARNFVRSLGREL